MLEHIKLRNLDDYFTDLNNRTGRGIYFYRIGGYSDEIAKFIAGYYDAARKNGVVIENRLPNPDEKQLSYYSEIMGADFQMSVGFFSDALKKWLPRMKDAQRQNMAVSVYDTLEALRKAGKTEAMLKNAYIKFMCWLYYKFERIINQLGENRLPKILYEGEIGKYELMLLSILADTGCDIVLLQELKAPASPVFEDYPMDGLTAFPADFSLKKIRKEQEEQLQKDRMYGARPSFRNCTNAWIKGKGLEDFRMEPAARGTDLGFYYNCFCRICGAEDKLTYANELYRFQEELKHAGRDVVIVNEAVPKPEPEEIAAIRRGQYPDADTMLWDLSSNIRYPANLELQKIMHQAFIDIMLEEEKACGGNRNRLTNQAVYLLCWLKRYQPRLFSGWKMPEIGCFIFLGGCRTESEALFLRFLARLPLDVLILCPDQNRKCCLSDPLLYEIRYPDSLELDRYPEERSQLQLGTAAYHAERELDSLMYEDSGMYRNQQYAKADALTLRTMYEEIRILWDQELKYRPGFSTEGRTVSLPVIFTKVSGVKNGAIPEYWASIRELLTADTVFIHTIPYLDHDAENPMRRHAVEFLKNGKVQKSRIKNHPDFPYALLKEEKQDHILDKLQLMLDQRLIRGTYENGTEYTVTAVALNLPKVFVRLIQKFDFTKKNPKLVYVNPTETMSSLEDAILLAFLNLIGFDILLFVPTGYQSVEKYYNRDIMEEHQTGSYLYDLTVPDLARIPLGRTRWRDKIFKRGN